MQNVFELNKKYEENDYNGIYNSISNFKIIKGNIPILLSAPHSVVHVRGGLFKRCDGLTGGIVESLSSNKDTFGITRIHNMLDDPNYYCYGISLLYKEAIIKLVKENDIKYLLDIHGCSDNHDFSIDIGTNNGANINNLSDIDILLHYFKKLGKATVDNKFKASLSGNVSRYVHEKTLIPCFQIEINSDLRFNKTEELINAFSSVIDSLNNKVKRKI